MAKANFQDSLRLVLRHEGGYVNHPRDPGGPTNLGVTQATLSGWLGRPATIADVKGLTQKTVAPIYKKQYWDRVMGDDLPWGLDYAMFDYAVNSGVSRAVREIQRILEVRQDGVMGIITLGEIKKRDPKALIDSLCDRRMTFLRGLRTFSTFGRGWTSRVTGVRSAALTMANNNSTKKAVAVEIEQPVIAAPVPQAKARDEDEKVTNVPEAGVAGTTGIGVIGATVSEAAAQVSTLTPYMEVAKWLFLILTLVGIGASVYLAWKRARRAE